MQFTPKKIPGQRGADLFVQVLEAEGIRHIFGNPGTTELSMLQALADKPSIDYILGLQEASVVAMADGYAQATGRPTVVNLHTAGGLGHAMGAIFNARVANTPLVITAGQQDTRHGVLDPLLQGDLVNIARPNVKWAEEVQHPEHIPLLLRRALQDCRTGPCGPVFLSLPTNTMEAMTASHAGRSSRIERQSVAPALADLAKILIESHGVLAIIVGEEVFAADAGDEVAKVASALGAPVFGSSWPGHIPFPTAHAQWRGPLPASMPDIRDVLFPFETVLLLGGHSLIGFHYSDVEGIASHCKLLQITHDAHQIGRYYGTDLGIVGDLKISLAHLLPILRRESRALSKSISRLNEVASEDREKRREEAIRRAAEEFGAPAITPLVAAFEVVQAVGPDIPIVDEAPATMMHVRACLNSKSSRQYLFTRSGTLGWGMPAAIGTSLGLDQIPVVCLVGDGSAMYSPQALWTAAHEHLPVTFIVMNNGEYNILKKSIRTQENYRTNRSNQIAGLDLRDPPIDFLALAASMGIPARRVSVAAEIGAAVQAGIRSGGPNLLELVISA